ncbi:MAG: hypothetical protein SEPTF4163_006334 [Sporothrix epigloea]
MVNRVVESSVKKQDLAIKSAVKERDHAFKRTDKKQVHFIEAAAKEKDYAVQEKDRVVHGTVKVHECFVKDATKVRVQMVEVAVAGRGRVNKDVKKQDNAIKSVGEEPD